MAPTINTTTSTWAQVGDFMIRSDGTTVHSVSLNNGHTAWTITLASGEAFTVGECHQAYTSVEAAMLVADALQ